MSNSDQNMDLRLDNYKKNLDFFQCVIFFSHLHFLGNFEATFDICKVKTFIGLAHIYRNSPSLTEKSATMAETNKQASEQGNKQHLFFFTVLVSENG